MIATISRVGVARFVIVLLLVSACLWGGDGTKRRGVRGERNRYRNIDGRKSDGKGGYLTGAHELVQFVQFDKVRHIPGVEIAWNEVVNEPGQSAVEDNISIYLSSGTND